MANSWTDEQKKVIETRGRSLLVSAAAGSGKTAVLVERILREILDPDSPIDLDKLLIVTFTRAATAQLRERVRTAVTKRAEEQPDDPRIRRQMSLLYSDHIMTIDRFFLMVIREHYEEIGLDPSFRIGDEGELKLMRSDAVGNVLEEAYEKGDPAFLSFSECYAPGNNDLKLEDMIDGFYEVSMSHAYPKDWRHQCLAEYVKKPREWDWLPALMDSVRVRICDLLSDIARAEEICMSPGGPRSCLKALSEDRELMKGLLEQKDYDQLRDDFCSLSFSRIRKKPGKGEDPYDPDKVALVDHMRTGWKDGLKKLGQRFFMRTLEDEADLMKRTGKDLGILVALTDRFEEVFSEAKQQKNILDFSDSAHLALQVLVEKDEDGKIRPTASAREYQDLFEEISIDEYQDSNEVQELLLSAVSREEQGTFNRFMVGDVKQSIYRFRMSDPGIFIQKYETYRKDGEGGQVRIDLHKNFRSRRQVLDAVNLIFRQIMRQDVGGVDYGTDEALYPGASFPALPAPWQGQEEQIYGPELIFAEPDDLMPEAEDQPEDEDPEWEEGPEDEAGPVSARSSSGNGGEKVPDREDPEDDEDEDEDEDGDPDGDVQHAEARIVAGRILQIVGHDPVYDREAGAYRPARFSDIVILLRTSSGWANVYSEVLAERGIPNRSGSKTGYFSAPEVRTILAYLNVLDNPRQDIPLTMVLRSEIGNLTDNELAVLKAGRKREMLFDCITDFLSLHKEGGAGAEAGAGTGTGRPSGPENDAGAGWPQDPKADGGASGPAPFVIPGGVDEQALLDKLVRFRDMTKGLRDRVPDTPIHRLLWQIYDETGYAALMEAAPGGKQKKANLDMLAEKAAAYEQTSYRGLFHFVRYIEKLRKYEVDFGAALQENGKEDLVRIMTIHSSKGLEFPIVFVAGLGKKFNRTDASRTLVADPEIGLGMNYVDPGLRVQVPTLIRSAVSDRVVREGIGEELRVLYVALTRAEEKLILAGTVKSRDKLLEKLQGIMGSSEMKLSQSVIVDADSCLTWVLGALLRHPSGAVLFEGADEGGRDPSGAVLFEGADEGGRDPSGAVLFEGADEGSGHLSAGEEAEGPAALPGSIRILTGRQVLTTEADRERSEEADMTSLLSVRPDQVYEPQLKKRLEEQLAAVYPWPDLSRVPAKVTVSELKKRGYEAEMARLAAEEGLPDSAVLKFGEEPESSRGISGEKPGSSRGISGEKPGSSRGFSGEEPARKPDQEPDPDPARKPAGKAAPANDRIVPEFMKETRENHTVSGAQTGTAVHRFLADFDMKRPAEKGEAARWLETMVRCDKITEDELRHIRVGSLQRFLDSDLGKRMREADRRGTLHRENPFVLSVRAGEIDPEKKGEAADEKVLIQGTIDAWFEETDGTLVLVDYKTDRVTEKQKDSLVRRYRTQFVLYREALERLTGRKVSQSWLYSLALSEALPED